MKTPVAFLAIALAAALCSGFSCATTSGPDKSACWHPDRYFKSPEEAVPVIADLLRKKEFATLAGYYDLSGSGELRPQLESGHFFVRKERPEAAHPGGFWRYKHPFAPGFEYAGRRQTSRPGVFVVEVSISIDQGAGPPQIGKAFFYMIQSQQGWQLLPDQVNDVPGSTPSLAD